MTRPLPFTEASIRRAVNGARKAGLRVISIRPDGMVMVQDGDDEPPLLVAKSQEHQIVPPSSKWKDAEI
jgi:hypothetical protein